MYEKKVQMQGLVFWPEKMLSYDEVFHVIHVAYGTPSECRGEVSRDIVKRKCGSCFLVEVLKMIESKSDYTCLYSHEDVAKVIT